MQPTVKKDPLTIKLAGIIASLLMRFVYYTSRKRFIGDQIMHRLLREEQPIILASWHNRNFLSLFNYLAQRPSKRTLVPMASASKDGGIAAWAMRAFGFECVRGSTNKGGFKAFKKMYRHARDGKDLAFTPDGPRGPLYTVHEGVILAARMTGAPIVPVTFQARRKKLLASWDRMIVPYPFNSLFFAVGEPFIVPTDCPTEEIGAYAQRLHEIMRKLDERVERLADGAR